VQLQATRMAAGQVQPFYTRQTRIPVPFNCISRDFKNYFFIRMITLIFMFKRKNQKGFAPH
jgi:hypothetical protein